MYKLNCCAKSWPPDSILKKPLCPGSRPGHMFPGFEARAYVSWFRGQPQGMCSTKLSDIHFFFLLSLSLSLVYCLIAQVWMTSPCKLSIAIFSCKFTICSSTVTCFFFPNRTWHRELGKPQPNLLRALFWAFGPSYLLKTVPLFLIFVSWSSEEMPTEQALVVCVFLKYCTVKLLFSTVLNIAVLYLPGVVQAWLK